MMNLQISFLKFQKGWLKTLAKKEDINKNFEQLKKQMIEKKKLAENTNIDDSTNKNVDDFVNINTNNIFLWQFVLYISITLWSKNDN